MEVDPVPSVPAPRAPVRAHLSAQPALAPAQASQQWPRAATPLPAPLQTPAPARSPITSQKAKAPAENSLDRGTFTHLYFFLLALKLVSIFSPRLARTSFTAGA